MSVRYNAQRLGSTAAVKRLCLAAVHHLCKWTDETGDSLTWDRLPECIRSLEVLERNTQRPAWGHTAAADGKAGKHVTLPMAVDDAELDRTSPAQDDDRSEENCGDKTDQNDESSSSSGTDDISEDSADDDGQPDQDHLELATVLNVPWVAPKHSQLIHVSRPPSITSSHLDVTPLCRDVVFVAGFQEGVGVADAARIGRDWCGRCLRRLAGMPPDAFSGSTIQPLSSSGSKACSAYSSSSQAPRRRSMTCPSESMGQAGANEESRGDLQHKSPRRGRH